MTEESMLFSAEELLVMPPVNAKASRLHVLADSEYTFKGLGAEGLRESLDRGERGEI